MTAPVLSMDNATLGRRLEQGRIPFPEALRYSTLLAEALRQIHDAGQTCGALQPSSILLTAAGLEILPSHEEGVTPYTAPEVLQGRTADARSDIFAFGAIVYEMITGRRAFAGDNADALALSLTISSPPPAGLPAVDHLVNHCLAKDPAARCSRMQKVILELKLLGFAEAPARPGAAAAIRAETQQLEARIASLLENHEEAISEIREATRMAVGELRQQVSTLQSELSSAHEQLARAAAEHTEQVSNLRNDLNAAEERLTGAGAEYGEQIAVLKSELAEARESLARAEQEHTEQVAVLKSDLAAAEERLGRAEQEHDEQVALLKSELAAAEERMALSAQHYDEQMAALRAEVGAAREEASRGVETQGEQYQRLISGVEQVESNFREVGQRISSSEVGIEVLSQRVTMLQEYQASRLQEFDQALRAQTSEMALISASQTQTDDLVEGVVAAMEVLQTSVFDFAEK